MSIWKNGKLVAGGRQATPLLSFMWADHILDSISWLRADTFSWQSGSVYQAVYQHLANDIDDKSLQSETIGGTTIQFYLANDGHKICPESEMSNVAAIYTATGVAWYYILDTTNERFKLPRTKFGFTGIRSGVGNYVEAGLPDLSGSVNVGMYGNPSGTGVFTGASAGYNWPLRGTFTQGYGGNVPFNASNGNSIYGNSDTVQPKATEMYLYFYVGEFTQAAIENTAGVVTEDFNELNAHKVIAFQAPTAANNYTWYRKYADGWVEQGGLATIPSRTNVGDSSTTVTFPIPMSDTNYTGQISYQNGGNYFASCTLTFNNRQTTGVNLDFYMNGSGTTDAFLVGWEVKGMAA